MAQKIPTVVTDLYKISNKLNPQSPAEVEVQEETVLAPPQFSEDQTQVSAKIEPQQRPVEEKKSLLNEVADAHLKRRYGDFQRSRSDLLDRLSTMESRLAAEEMALENRFQIVSATRQEIRQLLDSIPADDPAKDAFSDRAELTDLTFMIEKQRIEMMRIMPIVDGASEKMRSMDGAPAGTNGKTETGIILDSLGFRQILRLAFALSLPILIMFLIAAVIIAGAVIGSFKGLF